MSGYSLALRVSCVLLVVTFCITLGSLIPLLAQAKPSRRSIIIPALERQAHSIDVGLSNISSDDLKEETIDTIIGKIACRIDEYDVVQGLRYLNNTDPIVLVIDDLIYDQESSDNSGTNHSLQQQPSESSRDSSSEGQVSSAARDTAPILQTIGWLVTGCVCIGLGDVGKRSKKKDAFYFPQPSPLHSPPMDTQRIFS